MAFIRSMTTTAIPAAFTVTALSFFSSSHSPNSNFSFFKIPAFPILSASIFPTYHHSSLSRSFSPPRKSLNMDSCTSYPKQTPLPELLTEFMVDMKCDGCVTAVKNKLMTVDGVKAVEVDLSNQVVRVVGSSPVKSMADALQQMGRKARLIGQGNPQDFLVSAAVAEFKGPNIFGVVRFAQVNMELARIEASFSGISPGKHGWSINEYGDLTEGAASTGKVFNPTTHLSEKPLGDLGTLDAQETGDAFFSDVKETLRVSDLIGRAIVLYETEDKSVPGIVAAVIARSAGAGENYKRICSCDGTTIWESNNADFALSKV